MNPTNVLIHWAGAKMYATDYNVSDDALADMIVKKLEKYKGVSYSEVAEAALKAERHRLATIVLFSVSFSPCAEMCSLSCSTRNQEQIYKFLCLSA
jgi:hypothetical protein